MSRTSHIQAALKSLAGVERSFYALDVIIGVVEDRRSIFTEPTFSEIFNVACASYKSVDAQDEVAIRYLLQTDRQIYNIWRSRVFQLKAVETLGRILDA